jgi:hypothetical protein
LVSSAALSGNRTRRARGQRRTPGDGDSRFRRPHSARHPPGQAGNLKDQQVRILERMDRLTHDNPGDTESVGQKSGTRS